MNLKKQAMLLAGVSVFVQTGFSGLSLGSRAASEVPAGARYPADRCSISNVETDRSETSNQDEIGDQIQAYYTEKLAKFAAFSLERYLYDDSAKAEKDQISAPILSWDRSKLLPKRWYAGDSGKKPTVRSQGAYGTCWALTAVSALEAALLPEEELVFSADHLVCQNAFTAEIDEGGDYLMTMAYLSGWQGPVLEEQDPYGDGESPADLQPTVHVQEMQILEQASVSELKQAVYQYGAVQTSLYMSRETTKAGNGFYQPDTCGYYYPEQKQQNHDILILGWDDQFSRFQFAQVPDQDGAFICQNTWGESFGENGIFYVSYADANIGVTAVVYDRIETVDNYDHLYQTDDCGWQGRQGYAGESCWMANVYTAEQNETLSAFGFYATGKNTAYELYLVKGFYGEDSFDERIFLQSGTLQEAGYYTVDLEQPVSLIQGEQFAVIVHITTPGSENPVAVEYSADQYTQNVTLEGKNGYLSQYGEKWEHTESKFGTNVCLKAYTRDWTGY